MLRPGTQRALPFEGKRVLVTRAAGQAPQLSRLLRREGARVREIPLIEIARPRSWKKLDRALRRLDRYQWLILTSVNGVTALLARMRKLGLTWKQLSHLRVATIGPATQAAARRAGLKVSLTPREYIAEAVVRALKKRVKGDRILLVRATVARDVIPRALRRAGATVDVVAAYKTCLPNSARMKLEPLLRSPNLRPEFVTFTSSSTVRNFMRASKGMPTSGLKFASIGPVTSATLREFGRAPEIEASVFTMQGLVAAMVRYTKRH